MGCGVRDPPNANKFKKKKKKKKLCKNIKILQKKILIGQLLGEVENENGMKKIFELGQIFFFFNYGH
jgi:hypothetical protein